MCFWRKAPAVNGLKEKNELRKEYRVRAGEGRSERGKEKRRKGVKQGDENKSGKLGKKDRRVGEQAGWGGGLEVQREGGKVREEMEKEGIERKSKGSLIIVRVSPSSRNLFFQQPFEMAIHLTGVEFKPHNKVNSN